MRMHVSHSHVTRRVLVACMWVVRVSHHLDHERQGPQQAATHVATDKRCYAAEAKCKHRWRKEPKLQPLQVCVGPEALEGRPEVEAKGDDKLKATEPCGHQWGQCDLVD